MEFILQALTYPEIGEIIYTSSHLGSPNQSDPLADFRSAISQGADVIVTYPDIGDAYLPVFQEAKAAGIPVGTYAWGYVTGPGENYSTVVGEDTCALGEAFAQIINEQVGLGEDRVPRRIRGQPPVRVLAEVRRTGAEPGDRGRRHVRHELGGLAGAGGDGEPPRGAPGPQGHQLRVLGRNGARRAARPSRRRASRSTRSGRCGPTSPSSAVWQTS